MSVDVVNVLAAASEPIPEPERRDVDHQARQIAVLALVDALEHPDDERPVALAARVLGRGASATRMSVLVESLSPAHAHAVIEALTTHGYVDGEQARIAHARVDLDSRVVE